MPSVAIRPTGDPLSGSSVGAAEGASADTGAATTPPDASPEAVAGVDGEPAVEPGDVALGEPVEEVVLRGRPLAVGVGRRDAVGVVALLLAPGLLLALGLLLGFTVGLLLGFTEGLLLGLLLGALLGFALGFFVGWGFGVFDWVGFGVGLGVSLLDGGAAPGGTLPSLSDWYRQPSALPAVGL